MPSKKKADIFDVLEQDRVQVERVSHSQSETVEPSNVENVTPQHSDTVLPSYNVEPKPEKLVQKAVYLRSDQDRELRRLVKKYNYDNDADINASHLVRFLLDQHGGDALLAEFRANQEK